ncbi:MAG: hypothetical protein ACKVU4_12770 [Phycisphaerales bacterium]
MARDDGLEGVDRDAAVGGERVLLADLADLLAGVERLLDLGAFGPLAELEGVDEGGGGGGGGGGARGPPPWSAMRTARQAGAALCT